MMNKLTFALIGTLISGPALALTTQQQNYLDARQALKDNDLKVYQQLRPKLDHYPLTVYLDYHANKDAILAMSGTQAKKAMLAYKGTPLYQSARHQYLSYTGKNKQWQDFLANTPKAPKSPALQCYYYRAKLAQGYKVAAYKGADLLWNYGKSRPKACDPLFKAWQDAGQMTQSKIWSRTWLAFSRNQFGLVKYLTKQLKEQSKQGQLVLDVYRNPSLLSDIKKFDGKSSFYSKLVQHGLIRLSKKELNQAIKLFAKYQAADRFSDQQGREINHYLVRRALIKREQGLTSYIDKMLPILKDDQLYELRIRWALAENDKQTINHYLTLLSPEAAEDPRWQYWLAESLLTSAPKRADAILLNLSKERNFYGFAAAEAMNVAPNLKHKATPLTAEDVKYLKKDPGLARVQQLIELDKLIDARAEWHMLLGRHDKNIRAQYGAYALSKDWFDLAVAASIKAKLWNDMNMRFPYPATTDLQAASQHYNVNINEIRAIARRESAFYPYARSGVGARGLMQIMPATAKHTAKIAKIPYKHRKQLYDPQVNIELGSAYYSMLMKQFDQNRILATAAYNAGPHRVKRWLDKSDQQLDYMAFIETIPFTETREYVQAVFSYRLIYEIKQKQQPELFNKQELTFKY